MEKHQLIVLGSGPGGYVAAIRAAQLGFTVTVIEKDTVGGICLNWGCIPTKALLRSSELFSIAGHFPSFGIEGRVQARWDTMLARSRKISAELAKGVEGLFKKHKIVVKRGTGTLDGKDQKGMWRVRVTAPSQTAPETLVAPFVLLATGAKARVLEGMEGEGFWTYKDALMPPSIPQSLLVVGAGAIGVEFANVFHALGSKVYVVEQADAILPYEDQENVRIARATWEKRGIVMHTSTQIQHVETTPEGIKVQLRHAHATTTIIVEKVLLAIGIVPNSQNLGLEKAGVQLDTRGNIITNTITHETNVEGIYAIGDVAGAPWLAHKASHEGTRAVACMAQKVGLSLPKPLEVPSHSMLSTSVPACIYTFPQLASIGLTQEAATSQGIPTRVGKFPLRFNGKALAMGEEEGSIKVIFHEKTGALLGAHLVGAEVTELIHSFALAKQLEATEAELMETIFPHPTLSECIHEAVLDAYQLVLHK